MINQIGEVKRTDLDLRIEYLGLKTKIYRIEDERFVILCEDYEGDFEKLKEYFDDNIRPICCWVELTLKEPENYKEMIEGIALDDITSNFQGICLTKPEIDNMLTSKFHHIDFADISAVPGQHAKLIITVSDKTKDEDIALLEDFLSKMELSFEKVVVRKESDASREDEEPEGKWQNRQSPYYSDPIYCFTDKSFPFSVNDADYWFSNVEKIYQGKIDRDELPFFHPGETKCYLDFTGFKNVNLRNNILLYDKIYLSLPIENNLEAFLEHQNITKNELIELVEREKVVILLPNTELRYDRKLVMEAYNHKNNSVISKRGINALIACYMAEVEKSYCADYPEYREMIYEIHPYLKNTEDEKAIQMAKFMAWPLTAKLESFKTLNQCSPMAISHFGVNTVLEEMLHSLEKTNELSFEFVVNSGSIHIATALQATYFPFNEEREGGKYSDSGVSIILASLLNSYYYSSPEDMEQIKKVSQISRRENNYINLLNCDNTVSITRFADKAKTYNTATELAGILAKLERMDEKERRERISGYNSLLCDIAEIPDKERWKCLKYFLGAAGLIPILPPPISMGVALADLGVTALDKALSKRKEAEKKQIAYKINKATKEKPDKELVDDVYILDKIARIAKLQ